MGVKVVANQITLRLGEACISYVKFRILLVYMYMFINSKFLLFDIYFMYFIVSNSILHYISSE